jgi:hypothetical protein
LLEVGNILSGVTVICGDGDGDGVGVGLGDAQVHDTFRGLTPPDPVKVKVPF